MIESIQDMTVGQLTGSIALIMAGAATLIQIAPIKIDPWTALARAIGRAINGEVLEKVEKMEADITSIKENADERGAKAARARILRFGDEIRHGVEHSKEHFDDILSDITEYEVYCSTHIHFKNNRTKLTSKIIEDTYQKCFGKNDFI